MRSKTAVIVGANPLGREFARRVENLISFKGFFDDRGTERLGPEVPAEHLLGTLADLPGYVRENPVNQIYISLPAAAKPRLLKLLNDLLDSTASVYFVPDWYDFNVIQARFDRVKNIPVFAVRESPLYGFNGVMKRASDIVLASVTLLLVWPVLLVLATGVKLSSPGPTLFRQRCYGLEGEEIIVYKFRTAIGGDDYSKERRTTRFGRFLRRKSLDDLPQLINVLQGRMSVVGPEPHAVARSEFYREWIEGYMLRYKVRPGMTGLAQVNGFRGETETGEEMRKCVAYDLDYLRNWSLWLDLKIICRT